MESFLDTIVVGTDGTPEGERAVRAAGAVAAAMGAGPVHVVTACHRVSKLERDEALHQVPKEFRQTINLHEDAAQILDRATQILADYGVDAETHLIEERPSEALVDIAEHEQADLIVVGTRGLGPARRALLGSVSSKLVHHAPCAVLITGAH